MADLAVIISGMDKSIRGMGNAEQVSDLKLGLVGIGSGSVVLDIASNAPATTADMVASLAATLKENRPELLPEKSRTALQEILPVLKRNKENDCYPNIELYSTDAVDEQPIGVITPDMDFSYTPPIVTGQTVIYGRLMWIGGEKPRAHVKVDDRSLSCVLSHELACKLAGRLYEVVGLEGEAEWNTENWSIAGFTITNVVPYTERSVVEAIRAIAEAVGDGWERIDDVNAEIAHIRREKEI